MIRMTIYATEDTHMVKDPLVQRVSRDLEGQQVKVRRAERMNVPCTLITISDDEAMLA